jgi:hypothetical protein
MPPKTGKGLVKPPGYVVKEMGFQGPGDLMVLVLKMVFKALKSE